MDCRARSCCSSCDPMAQASKALQRRGRTVGGAATGDGPRFFIALADLPHLGVSHTVWGHVVEDDLAALASVAAEVAEGRRAVPIACGVESRNTAL